VALPSYNSGGSAEDPHLGPEFDPFGGGLPGGTNPYELSGIGIQGENVRDVAGASRGQALSSQMAQAMGAPSQGEGAAWTGLADLMGNTGRMASGEGMATDPGIQAAYDTFETFEMPMIEDAYSEMGLGRSDMKGDKMSLGLASLMQPAIQDYLGREGEMINRDVGIAGNAITSGLNLAGTELNRQATSYDALPWRIPVPLSAVSSRNAEMRPMTTSCGERLLAKLP
jgi:hypothetical protein